MVLLMFSAHAPFPSPPRGTTGRTSTKYLQHLLHKKFEPVPLFLPCRSCTHYQQRAEAQVKTARRSGVSIREFSTRSFNGPLQSHDLDGGDSALTSHRSLMLPPLNAAQTWGRNKNRGGHSIDEEQGGLAIVHNTSRLRSVAECRDRSHSVWLHFPHVELLFLLFAFEGAMTSELSALRSGGCPPVFFTAVVVLVSLTELYK